MAIDNVGKEQLRSFGLIVGAGFAVIALWPAVARSQSPRLWALALAAPLLLLACVAPAVLRPIHRWWMAIGGVLGWVNTRVILTIVYYVLIVPIGAIRRMRGIDPMRRALEPEATTYKVGRSPRPSSHMRRQY
jgi:hypothetical protein